MRLSAIAAWSLLTLLPQNPVVQPSPTPKGSIEGLILHVTTGEAIAGARVTLQRVQSAPTALPALPGALPTPAPVAAPAGPQTNPAVNSDAQGKFLFKDVEPGQYRVLVANNGFARTEYGQKIFGAQGTTLTVTVEQPIKDLVVRLTPAGNVSGMIRDISGKPVVGVQVQLIKASYNPGGQRSYQSAGSTRTNDHGEYRLYWVTPGRYYLNAGSSQGGPANIGGGGASPNEVQDVYVSTYYPNVTDVSRAAALEVRPGNEISGIDVSIDHQQVYRVRGRVFDTRTDRPPQAATLSVSSRSLTGGGFTLYGGNQKYNSADGSFELRDIAPGTYVIGAQVTEISGRMTTSPSQQNEPRAQASVVVTNGDIENLQLTIVPPMSMPGRLSIEGQSLSVIASLDRMRVQLVAPPDAAFFGPGQQSQSQPVNANGEFKIDNLSPGDYRVTVSGMPPGYYLKAARLEQTDMVEQPAPVTTAAVGPLDVILSPNGGQIDGAILDEKRQALRGIQAVLIPDRQRNRIDLYKTAISDQNGQFTIRGIPPGDYKVFAWEALEQFGYFDADLMSSYEAKGKSVHITESSKQSVEVKVIPSQN